MDRKGFIGASEVSAILGLNPFCTALNLWALKTGKLEKPEEATEGQEWGKRLERVVSHKFAEKHNVKLIAYKKRFVHPTMSFFSCELDNIIASTTEIVEIKTVNAFDWKKWDKPDELPAYVIVQVMAQMGLTGRTKAWVAVLCGGQKYIEKEVSFDAELWSKIEQAVKDFWENFVIANTPPLATSDDKETLLEIFPKELDAEMLQNYQDMENDIARRQELAMHIDAMKEEKEGIENKLRQIIGEHTGIITQKYTVKNKLQRTAPKIDFDAMKIDNIYGKYATDNFTRVLRITLNKGERDV